MATKTNSQHPEVLKERIWLARQSRAPRLRTMREFAEQEIIIPDGPYAGRRYRCDRQPYSGLYLDAVDSGSWTTIAALGPTQSGKTLTCSVIPIAYHLFEIRETVVFGVPDLDMAADKWTMDLLPALERTRYRDLLPRKGSGSRGGLAQSIHFRNGATLRFMTGGGGDKSRAAFTTRVVVVTEVDGMDSSGGTSREADKITQLIARTRAYGRRRRVYLECTVTTPHGRIWREYQAGTASRIALPCPHCGACVTPEREHLTGWKEAETEIEAQGRAAWCCPACGAPWSEEERITANRAGHLVHRGQNIEKDGTVTGELPRTNALGFRWSAINNLFVAAGDVGAEEWKASRTEDSNASAEKEMSQFVWAVPWEPVGLETTVLSARQLMGRTGSWKRGELPDWTEHLTVGCDLGKRAGHWLAVAWGPQARGHIIDYGVIEIPADAMGVERALAMALREFRDEVLARGWGDRKPDRILLDSRWQPAIVRAFCRESGQLYFPSVGFGETQRSGVVQQYSHPRNRGGNIAMIGENYHIAVRPGEGCVVNINADAWKSWIQNRLACPTEDPGAMTLFAVHNAHEHLALAKHLMSERKVQEFVAGRGMITRWEQVNQNNHWLDALELAAVAGHSVGVRLMMNRQPKAMKAQYAPKSIYGDAPVFPVHGWRIGR